MRESEAEVYTSRIVTVATVGTYWGRLHNLSLVDDRPKSGGLPNAGGGMDRAADKTTRRALVADDESLIRWSVAETLADLGMNVRQAGDAAATLEAIDQATDGFDIVILDLRMPDVDDLTLLAKVRRLLPSATVILMTAFGSPEIVAGARELGVHAVLSKPFELEHLRRLLESGNAPVS